MSEWEITNESGTTTVGISTLPGRKRPAMYAINGSRITPLAYFRSVEDAEEADRLLGLLATGRKIAEEGTP